jgi:hypothetical protein
MKRRTIDCGTIPRVSRLVVWFVTAFSALGYGAVCAQIDTSVPVVPAAIREVAGSVIALNWSDPVVELTLLTDDGSTWQVRTAPMRTLAQIGIGAQSLTVGTALKVAGWAQPGRDNVLRATNILVSANREIVLQRGANRRWIGAPP